MGYLPNAEIEISANIQYPMGHLPNMDLRLAESHTTTWNYARQVVTMEITWYANPNNFREVVKEIEGVMINDQVR